MVTVEMLESQIATLGEAEFKQLAVWFHEFEKRIDEPRCAISGMTATGSVDISRTLAEFRRVRTTHRYYVNIEVYKPSTVSMT